MDNTENIKTFLPHREFAKNSRIKNMCEYNELMREANEDNAGFWARLADETI